MKSFIFTCALVLSPSVFASEINYDNSAHSLVCTVYTRELGQEVNLSAPLTEKGAVLEELVGGRYQLKVVAKAHRCILSTDVRDLVAGGHDGSSGGCSVNSYSASKDINGVFTYYHFCKTVE